MAEPTVLVLTAEAITGPAVDQVVAEVRRAAGGDDDPGVFVVAPALVDSALKHTMGDVDDAIAPARERLERSLRELREAGLTVAGEVGDPDPVQALSDELQKFEVPGIVVVDHADSGESAYAEKELLDRVRADLEPPVTELRVRGHEEGERVVERHTAPAGEQRAEEGRRVFSENLPPIRSRDGVALLIAVFLTIAMVILAGACPSATGHDGEALRDSIGPCTWVFLIAGGFFLINLGHIVALTLMESVKYRGPFERFFSRVTNFGTPIGFVAVIAIMAAA